MHVGNKKCDVIYECSQKGLPVIFCCLLISSRGCSATEATWGGVDGLTIQVTWPEGGDWVSNLSSSEPGETEPPEGSEPPLAWSLSLACCSASWCLNTKIFGILFCHNFFSIITLTLNHWKYYLNVGCLVKLYHRVVALYEKCFFVKQ